MAALRENHRVQQMALQLNVPVERVQYLADLILKYLLYAEQSGNGYYLSHPVRSKLRFEFLGASLTPHPAPKRPIPIRLGPYIAELAEKRGRDWLSSTLHETKGFLEQNQISQLRGGGTVDREVLRTLAARIGLPAQIRGFDTVKRTTSIANTSGGIATSIAVASPWPAVIGSAMTLATDVWTGHVPGPAAKIKWIQWMLEWPLEHDAED
ncbi:hypothetical protein [Nocardia sp. XZ_19_369]|uniref:hypothetical protein n=1 Tax=Nocardia sp. XZ_19_369 TaxID=2769487 RepID=UPI00188E59C6|nr:hypothetical protein [Nocardia sp. XZ_19_369]